MTAPAPDDSSAPARRDDNMVLVLAAASTSGAIEEIAAAFEREHGTKVQISVGPSNALANQILAGAPADVYLSANAQWADAVHTAGLAAETRGLLANRLVIVVPHGNPAGIRAPEDLIAPGVQRVALAGEYVPAGIYAAQAVSTAGVYEQLVEQEKIARGHDVRVALSYVELGEAEAGVVYATDARVSKDVEAVYTFPPSSHEPIEYPVVLLRHADGNPAARPFFDYLASGNAKRVFEKYGFEGLDAASGEGRNR